MFFYFLYYPVELLKILKLTISPVFDVGDGLIEFLYSVKDWFVTVVLCLHFANDKGRASSTLYLLKPTILNMKLKLPPRSFEPTVRLLIALNAIFLHAYLFVMLYQCFSTLLESFLTLLAKKQIVFLALNFFTRVNQWRILMLYLIVHAILIQTK